MPASREAGGFSPDAPTLHQGLVDQLVEGGSITSAAVEVAFRTVPRHPFLPGEPLERVYRDAPVVTKRRDDGVPVSSSSQPAAMAIMLEQLDVRPGHRVLEIGTGTGYNTALLARLAGPDGLVVSVDIEEDIVAGAIGHLKAAAIPTSAPVHVYQGDGGRGWPDERPYDRIILTVGAWDVVPAWIEQLAPVGRLLVPLWLRGAQRTVAFERDGDHLRSVSVSTCAFMRLRGAFAGPEGFVPVGEPGDAMTIATDDQAAVNPAAIAGLLQSPSGDTPTGVSISGGRDVWSGLGLWLALHDPQFCALTAERPSAVIPTVASQFHWTVGLTELDSLALLAFADEDAAANDRALVVRWYGAGRRLADRLAEHVIAWDRAGRPDDSGLHLNAFPIHRPSPAPPGATILAKRWHRFVITWT
jgi:protein-L-isoaspartate(D-aspartate) O-methyltransferase